MGAAARKPMSADVRAGDPSGHSPQYCENVVLPASPNSPALLVSFESVSMPPQPPPPLHHEQQHQQGLSQHHHTRSTPVQLTSSPGSGTFLDSAPGGRLHLNPPRSPGSGGGRLSDESPARPPPPRSFIRRLHHSSTTTTSLSASTPCGASLREPAAVASTAPTAATTSTKTPGTLTAAPPTLARSHSSLNSSCSAFSLYSAESSLRELPPLPASMQAAFTAAAAANGGGGVDAVVTGSPASPVSPAVLEEAIAALQLESARPHPSSSATAAAVVVTASASPPPRGRVDPITFSAAALRAPLAPLRPSSAGRSVKTPSPHPSTSAPVTPAVAQSCSNFLLDMSFDSRALTSNPAATTAEIQRIGQRLQMYQRGPAPSSPKRVSAVVPGLHSSSSGLNDPLLTPSAGFSPTDAPQPQSPQFPKFPPLTPPVTSSVGGPSTTTTTAAAAVPAAGSVENPYYMETVKFVEVIQQLQRARDAERTSYTWFRPEAIQAAAAAAAANAAGHGSSLTSNPGVFGRAGDADGMPLWEGKGGALHTGSSSGDNAQSSSSDTGREGQDEAENELDAEAELRASLRRRDRLPALVHWLPYETFECDPLTPLNTAGGAAATTTTTVCFCGFSGCSFALATTAAPSPNRIATTTTTTKAATASSSLQQDSDNNHHNSSRTNNNENVVSGLQSSSPLLSPRELPSTTGTQTPPLPSVLATGLNITPNTAAAAMAASPAAATGHASGEGDKLSPTSAGVSGSGSGPHLTSSTTVTTSSADSTACCPLHVSFRPPSIYIMHHWEKSRSSTGPSSPVRRQQLISGQVDVPASAVSTPRPSATPLPPLLSEKQPVEAQWRETSGSNNTSGNTSATNSNSNNSSNQSNNSTNRPSLVGASVARDQLLHSGSHTTPPAVAATTASSAVKRAIIDVGVPHRRQLAKKALEENNLFFESILRRQRTDVPRAQTTNSTK